MDNFLIGFQQIFQAGNMLALVGGSIVGVLMGAMPGIGSTLAVSLLIPFTFTLTPAESLILLTTVYSATVYGGSISAILLKIPGSYESVATTFDGYELAKQGKASKALGVSMVSSFLGGTFSVIVMILMAPQLANIALIFGPPEYFALGVLGLSIITSFGTKSLAKSLFSGLFGLFLATVGMDSITGFSRFDFGVSELKNGISFIPVIIGLFAISEVFRKVQESVKVEHVTDMKSVSSELPTRGELKNLRGIITRGSIIGTIIGILPGVGGTVAALLGYSEAVRTSKHPERFGTGILEGVAAPESANNAACGGAMIPLLSLGIPGSAVTAVLVGAFMIQGLRPGPMLFVDNIELVYTIFVGMLLANVLILPLGLFGIKPIVKMLDIPYKYMALAILVLCFIGSFAINNSLWDVWIMFVFGLVGYAMSKHKFPYPPMILGMVLGPITEISCRRALLMFHGNWGDILARPIVAVLLLISVVSLFWPLIRDYINKEKVASSKA